MNMNEREHIEYHKRNDEGWQRHIERLRRNDVLGEDYRFECAISPADFVMVRRFGSKGMDSSYANLSICVHGEVLNIYLSAKSARKMAGALLEIADELEPYQKGTAADDLIRGEK